MNKTIKRLTIAAVTLLGATYALKKYNDNKRKKQSTSEVNNNQTEENYGMVNGQRYVILSEVYNDAIKGNIGTIQERESDRISDFSTITDRKYHALDMTAHKETITEPENTEIKRK